MRLTLSLVLLIALALVDGGCVSSTTSSAKLGFRLPPRARYTVTDRQFEKAKETLQNYLSPDTNQLKVIIASPCVCGPVLWHLLKDSPHFSVPPVAKTVCQVPLKNGRIQEFPAALLQSDAEAANFRAALADLLSENGTLTFRLPTESEFKIYWAVTPFDEISGPLIVAEGSRFNLIIEFAGGRPFWFDEVTNITLKK